MTAEGVASMVMVDVVRSAIPFSHPVSHPAPPFVPALVAGYAVIVRGMNPSVAGRPVR